MKKVVKLVMVTAFIGLFSFNCYSQDGVVDVYNQTIQAVQSEDYDAAINFAEKTYDLLKGGAEAEEVKVETLEELIPQLYLSKAKKSFADSKYTDAVNDFNKAAEVAKKFNNDNIAKEAEESVVKVYLKEANDLFTAENYDGAIAAFDKALAIDSTNSQAYMVKGASYLKKGDNANALTSMEKALEVAKENEDANVEKQATAQLANMYLKAAADAQKTKKWDDVIKNSEKSLEYKSDNKQALQLLDLGNYQAGAAIKDTNKAKACQYFKKVKNNEQLKTAAAQMIKILDCK